MIRITKRLVLLSVLLIPWLIGPRVPDSWAICAAAYENILVDRFSIMMKHKDFVLINVHTPYQGEIPQTDLLIPYNMIESRQSELPADKSAKIVVYGLTGPMGYAAAQKLSELGFYPHYSF